jgi:hypothetical protein
MNKCTKCEAPLPVHLADIADDSFSHVCSCGDVYKVVKGNFVETGQHTFNPFATCGEGEAPHE